jgi:hypothetical protein
MGNDVVKTTKELLVEHLVKWHYESGEDKSQAEFAALIGETEKYLSQIMNGRKPSKRQTILFAEVLNDPRFYDAAGIDRPEPLLSYTKRNWGSIPEEVKKNIAEQISAYTTEKPPQDGEG